MKITSKKLLGLPVVTKSGAELGRLDDFSMDTDFQNISEYYVKPAGLVGGLVKGKLIISRGQVIDISAQKMTVDDNFAAGAEK
jgi:sporulation protein YlmC with PRC-barrel domain